jgi:hypothetical protein
MTKHGEIYLVGGSVSQGQKSSSIFVLDLRTIALIEIGRLLVPRSSHSLVELPGGIGVIGGYSNGQLVIDQCEFFDTGTKAVQPLGKLNYAVASPGVCSFKEQSLIKVGGIDSKLQLCNQIELLRGQQWTSLKHNGMLMTSMCCCIQIE